MKKLIINDKEIDFFIDYLRINNKANHDYSNVDYDYNCTLTIVSKTKLTDYEKALTIVSKTKLTDYEKEIISRYIKAVVNKGGR